MNKQTPTLNHVKREAKQLKKELGIKYIEALESVSKKYGFSNWTHCQRILSQQKSIQANKAVASAPFEISFADWLSKHKNRNSPLGDLASDMLRDQKDWPLYNTLEEYVDYLEFKGAYYRAVETLKSAWKVYKAYVKRKNMPDTKKHKTNKPKPKNQDQRKITFVKGVTPLHFTKRTQEKFNSGDKAWISWDGSKAIPVTITEVDEHYYTFIVERPAKKAGNEHYLRLDEVRSTPELACINRVTS